MPKSILSETKYFWDISFLKIIGDKMSPINMTYVPLQVKMEMSEKSLLLAILRNMELVIFTKTTIKITFCIKMDKHIRNIDFRPWII